MASDFLLSLDAGSPVVSVAVGPPGEAVAERSIEIRQSSERLVALVDECLREAGVAMAELAGVLALGGPGSFTGLRVGLATTLGFHQALGLPATAVPTLEVLALHGRRRLEREAGGHRSPARIAGAVDALRGEWFVQLYEVGPGGPPNPVPGTAAGGEAQIVGPAALAALRADAVCGFGVGRLADDPAWTGSSSLLEAAPLAADLLRLAALRPIAWRPETLVSPLYLRPPAVSLPKRRPVAREPR